MTISKEYPPRCGMRLVRSEESQTFTCSRCTEAKKSRLYASPQIAPEKRICNGCYGYLLSVYDIGRKDFDEDEKADLLATALLQAFSKAQKQEAERLFRIVEKRAEYLDPKSVLFLSTSDLVEAALAEKHELDWSPAIIGYCKAVENEVVTKLLAPFASTLAGSLPKTDLDDKDFGRVAKYCNCAETRPPELGSFAYFLQTFANSTTRRASSVLLQSFDAFLSKLPKQEWLVDPKGLCASLMKLCADFRNRAAHLDPLSRSDYFACRDFVCGNAGLIWNIVSASMDQKTYNKA